MSNKDKRITPSTRSDIDTFLKQVAQTPRVRTTDKQGRLMFAMDATASREPTWDHACHIQAQMFDETASLGGLQVQLVYYRGFADFHVTPWCNNAKQLLQDMTSARCMAGHTQIEKILQHAIKESQQQKIDALVFVGDCMEENIDALCQQAGKLALMGVPMFIFHEGYDPVAKRGFEQLARITNGACSAFDINSAQQLKDLLSAVAVYAAGGRMALENFNKRKGKTVLQIGYKK